jgi:hypothetical protein
LNLISIHPQLYEQKPILRVHTYLGCINTKCFYTVLCIKMNHMLTLKGILHKTYFIKACKITTGQSLTSNIVVVLCHVTPNGHYSSEYYWGLMAQLYLLFGQPCVGNMTHNVYVICLCMHVCISVCICF